MSDFNNYENEVLVKKIEKLEALLQSYHNQEQQRNRLEYERVKGILRKAIFVADDIGDSFKTILEKIDLTSLLTKLINANNPMSKTIGFNFVSVVTETAKTTLLSGIPPDREQAKDRFIKVLEKIVNNPIATALVKSNPVGAVVSNVINAAATFLHTKVGNKVREVVNSVDDVIKEDRIKMFYENMKKYILFYENIAQLTTDFQQKLDVLKLENQEMEKGLVNFQDQYFEKLGIEKNGDELGQFELIFELKGDAEKGFNYLEICNQKQVLEGMEFALRMPSLKAKVELVEKKFSDALGMFLKDYLKVLRTALDWDQKDIDKSLLKDLISYVDSFLEKSMDEIERNTITSRLESRSVTNVGVV